MWKSLRSYFKVLLRYKMFVCNLDIDYKKSFYILGFIGLIFLCFLIFRSSEQKNTMYFSNKKNIFPEFIAKHGVEMLINLYLNLIYIHFLNPNHEISIKLQNKNINNKTDIFNFLKSNESIFLEILEYLPKEIAIEYL